jgi:uncharacterized protein
MVMSLWQREHWLEVEHELARVVEALRAWGVEKVILYGSYARGDFHEDSDVDLLIVKDTNERFVERISTALGITGARIPIEPIVYTPAELSQMRSRGSGLLADAEREGKVLYERSA